MLDRRLLFVTGKGGVGKTTVAAALALHAAATGRRTLVCEADAKGDVAAAYEAAPLRFEARELQPGLHAMAMDTEASLKEYLALNLRLPLLSKLGPLASIFDFVATAAPGVKEILTVGKLAYEVREGRYDLVVVDAMPTGHVVGQLAAPQALAELVSVGLIRSQTAWMLDILSDPSQTGLVIVATPEEMPVVEALELSGRVRRETTVDLAAVVANRVLPELFGRGEEAAFERLRSPSGVAALEAVLGPAAEDLLEAASLATSLRRTRATHLERLREGVPAGTPVLYVPELFSRAGGLRTTHLIADALAAELDAGGPG